MRTRESQTINQVAQCFSYHVPALFPRAVSFCDQPCYLYLYPYSSSVPAPRFRAQFIMLHAMFLPTTIDCPIQIFDIVSSVLLYRVCKTGLCISHTRSSLLPMREYVKLRGPVFRTLLQYHPDRFRFYFF